MDQYHGLNWKSWRPSSKKIQLKDQSLPGVQISSYDKFRRFSVPMQTVSEKLSSQFFL